MEFSELRQSLDDLMYFSKIQLFSYFLSRWEIRYFIVKYIESRWQISTCYCSTISFVVFYVFGSFFLFMLWGLENNDSWIYKSAKSSTRRISFLDTRLSCFNYLLTFYKRCYCMCVVNAVTLYSGGSLTKTRYLIFPLVKANILDKILAWNF